MSQGLSQEGSQGLGVPEWIVAIFIAAVGITFILEKLGKLPGSPGNRRSGGFSEHHAAQLKKTTDLLATRIGESSQERFTVMFERQVRELELLTEIRDILKRQEERER